DARTRLQRNDLKTPDRIIDGLAQIPRGVDRVVRIDFKRLEATRPLGFVDLRAPICPDHRAVEGAMIFLLEQGQAESLAVDVLIFGKAFGQLPGGEGARVLNAG